MSSSRTEQVKAFFDTDSRKYLDQRYPDEPRTHDQLSYVMRRQYMFEMLERSCPTPGRILDIGCGPGVLTKDLLDRGWQTSALDLSPRMLEIARQSVADHPRADMADFQIGQATRLPFESGTFDAVLCMGVISYVDDIRGALSEIARVLKPGGHALLQISNIVSPVEWDLRLRAIMSARLRRPESRDHHDRFRMKVRLIPYRPWAFRRLVRGAGLTPRDWHYYDFHVPFLERVAPSLSLAIGRAGERLSQSSLFGWLGAGYVLTVEKPR